MKEINTKIIEKAIYTLCITANTQYSPILYKNIYTKYKDTKDKEYKIKLLNILKNAQLAEEIHRPLCQDTGQVLVFLKIGQDIHITGCDLTKAINSAIKKAYKKNFYRKSVVKNALFNRENTKTNTPAIIYTEIVSGESIEINLLIKGAGSENYCITKMLKPTAQKNEIFELIKDTILSAGEKACPPMVIGVGIGGTMDSAAIMSKKAFFEEKNTKEEKILIKEINNYLANYNNLILDIKLQTSQTHIACMPVAITINCHSTRHASCKIKDNNIIYTQKKLPKIKITKETISYKEIKTDEIEKIKNLKNGENILLTGYIYTARDAAHKRIEDYYKKREKFPFDIKNKIIFYAGPCPAAKNEIIGPIGPTTSTRMDKFCNLLYSNGLLATIGKGERTNDALKVIEKNKGKYFVAEGGIACLLAKCVKSSEIIAFEDLGTEAVRKLYVEKFPIKVKY